MMKWHLFFFICLFIFISACGQRIVDTYSQSNFESITKAEGYKYFARAQLPSTITADGLGDNIRNGAWPGASMHSQEQANQVAMDDCGYGCILSSMNGQITQEAQKYIDIAKVKREEERIKKEKKEQEFIASIPNLSNLQLCENLINTAGFTKTSDVNYGSLSNEQLSRGLSNEDCNVITGRFTSEQKKIIAQIEKEQKAEKLKQQKISIMKKDCEELGFKDNTEGMGNCILKMMELEQENSPKVVTTTNQTSNNAEMLEIERAKLKAEQERLEVEKQRAWIERQEQLNRIGTQSINQGWCLMNGGGWGC